MACLLPKYWKLFQLSHYTFIYDAAKHKKSYKWLISQFVSNIKNTKEKEIYIKMVDHGKVTETYVAEIIQNKIYCDKFIYLKASVNEVT